VFQRGADALGAIQACVPNLFIAGTYIEDMDGLEHLEPFIESDLPILVLTSRKDARTFNLLREVRYGGIFDAWAEGLENLQLAIDEVMDGQLYVSPTVVPHVKKPRNSALDALTNIERVVLSVLGEGADDLPAGERLGLSPSVVNTHRKTIMSKLCLQYKMELMLFALQQGYVRLTPSRSERWSP
jgi:DNA-binding NarL/FixJ family response regulator